MHSSNVSFRFYVLQFFKQAFAFFLLLFIIQGLVKPFLDLAMSIVFFLFFKK